MKQQHQASEESVVALREQGLRLLKEGNYAEAARALEAAAMRGDACAQNAFGVMHDGMFGLTRDWEAYIHWISLAAEQQYTPPFTISALSMKPAWAAKPPFHRPLLGTPKVPASATSPAPKD